MKNVILGLVAVACSLAGLFAQGQSQNDPQPTCNMCPATYIPNEEIQAYAKKAMAEKLTDQQVRDIELGKAHVGIGVVYRGKLNSPASESVAEHDLVSEVYHIIEGTATLSPVPIWSARSGGRRISKPCGSSTARATTRRRFATASATS